MIRESAAKKGRYVSARGMLTIVLLLLIGILVIAITILSCVPPVSRDALTHHLLIPKLYLENGGICELPDIVFSYYPMNVDLLYMIPLIWEKGILAKFIHFGFSLLTAGLIYRYLKVRLDRPFALLGVVLFLSVPIIAKLSTMVYVDLGLCFFSFAAIYFLLKWLESDFQTKYLIVSAVFCGLALGTKYNGLIVFFILTLFVPFFYSRTRYAAEQNKTVSERAANGRQCFRAIGYGVIFMVISLLVFSPWMVRNYVWTNNPIYPLLNSWFGMRWVSAEEPVSQAVSSAVAVMASGKLNHFSMRGLAYGESWWQILLVPVRIFFQGQDGNPQFFDGRLNPFLFFLPFLAFIGHAQHNRIKTEKLLLAGFSVLFLLFAFVNTDMRIRYVIPMIPPLVILSIWSLFRLHELATEHFSSWAGKACRGCLVLVISVMLFLNARYIAAQFSVVQPMDYLMGRITRQDYLKAHIAEYPVLQYANKTLSEDARILSLFLGNRGYYSDIEMVHTQNIFRTAMAGDKTPDQVSAYFRKQGITHMLIREDLYEAWVKNSFNASQISAIGRFFNTQTRLMVYYAPYALYELR